MSGLFSFLKDVQVMAAENKTRKAGGGVEKNPKGLALRVYHTGAVYPSTDLVDKFNLEYRDKPVEGDKTSDTGNGLDIFSAGEWSQLKTNGHFFMVMGAVPRRKGKIDLFGQVAFDEAGKPASSVLTQGSTTFGKNSLLKMIEENYGEKLDKDNKPFIDLIVVDSAPLEVPKGIAYVPKKISRGDKKDEMSYERREKFVGYALAPASHLEEGTEEVAEEKGQPLVAH